MCVQSALDEHDASTEEYRRAEKLGIPAAPLGDKSSRQVIAGKTYLPQMKQIIIGTLKKTSSLRAGRVQPNYEFSAR